MASEDDNKFLHALAQGSCDIVDAMIEKGYIPKTRTIIDVCRRGNLDLLITLLKCFENVRQPSDEPKGPNPSEESKALLDKFLFELKQSLHGGFLAAVEKGHVHLLDHLYLSGVDINLPTVSGSTALHKTTDPHTCKWLLNMGVQQTTNNHGQTPVHIACSNKSTKVLKLLLQYPEGKESLTKYDGFYNTPIIIACNFNRLETIKLILQYPEGRQSLTMTNKWKSTPLNSACASNLLEVVCEILQHPEGRQTVNECDIEVQTPLYWARIHNDDEMIDLLTQYS